ncbi:hypothetical protein Sjap_018136 [Stephania japonica]|uniref:mitogen-activated protein kinase kinase kinase n=1 Tax=Stephania japonica TaxID=461633 RepID=A0AAP0I7E8_9MAGN
MNYMRAWIRKPNPNNNNNNNNNEDDDDADESRHRRSGGDMDAKQKLKRQQQRRKPRLDRRNAIKNIDYEPADSASEDSNSSARRTRSLELSPYSDRSSFRIGGLDGDIDRMFCSLGLSGPEDLAIPAAAWEARKAKSSSDILSRLNPAREESGSGGGGGGGGGGESGGLGGLSDLRSSGDVAVASNVRGSSPVKCGGRVGNGGGGIKGVRPPALAPPPSMTLPDLGNAGSTWDILKAFAPEDDSTNCGDVRGGSSRFRRADTSSSDEEQEEDEVSDGDEVEEIGGGIGEGVVSDGLRLGEIVDLSESCSFSTSNDDDTSSTNTDPTYIISPNGRFRCNIRSWTKGTLLGSGSFGTVYEGLSEDGFFFAVKEVSLLDPGRQAQQSIHQLEQEIALLSQFEHENIVRYLGTDKDHEKLYIFLELVTKGSLSQLYQRYHLQDSQVSAYTRQILQGLKYLHDRNVVHRDIKCANILVDANGSVKLADFGLAKATKLNDVKSCKGTAFWMAPEVVNLRNRGYGLAADIWSLGCTVLEMLTRQLPYFHLESMQALFRIGKGELPHVPDSLSREAQDFILKCLQVNPDNRPTAAQLLVHPFVRRPLTFPSEVASPSSDYWKRS